MKLRESGMPDEAYWESLFDVGLILDRLGIDNSVRDVVELGCGYGTFTLPVARRISGAIETIDVDPAMVKRTRERAAEAGLENIICHQRDVLTEGLGMAAGSQDACLLFNILHGEDPVQILREAAQAIRPTGRVLIIHWRFDPGTPRGPSLDIRPRPEQISAWAEQVGLQLLPPGIIDLPPYHYGMAFSRK